MNITAPTLSEQQTAVQDWLMHGSTALSRFLPGDRRAERMRIYADAYQLRLIDILANDFPVLRARVGEAMFETLATGYLHAHPSRNPSARHFGRDFAAWLQHQEHPSSWIALARFEWMQGEVFDAVDAPVLALEQIAALPADTWPGLRLELQSALRILRVPASIPAMVDAHTAGQPVTMDADATPATWLLWRRDFIVHWRCIDDDEASLLESVRAGATFSDLCAHLAAHMPEPDAALRVVGLLKLWINDGLVAAVISSPNTSL